MMGSLMAMLGAVSLCCPAGTSGSTPLVTPGPDGGPVYRAPKAILVEPLLPTSVVVAGEELPWTLDLGDWLRLAECESSGRWHLRSEPYRGGLQFLRSSWQYVGGEGDPADATVAEQIHRGRLLLDLQGPGAWPVCSRQIGWGR
jgi:hypothetical protein